MEFRGYHISCLRCFLSNIKLIRLYSICSIAFPTIFINTVQICFPLIEIVTAWYTRYMSGVLC